MLSGCSTSKNDKSHDKSIKSATASASSASSKFNPVLTVDESNIVCTDNTFYKIKHSYQKKKACKEHGEFLDYTDYRAKKDGHPLRSEEQQKRIEAENIRIQQEKEKKQRDEVQQRQKQTIKKIQTPIYDCWSQYVAEVKGINYFVTNNNISDLDNRLKPRVFGIAKRCELLKINNIDSLMGGNYDLFVQLNRLYSDAGNYWIKYRPGAYNDVYLLQEHIIKVETDFNQLWNYLEK